jgi:hypothetical protein
MDCPVCETELDPDLEEPACMYYQWPASEIPCTGCGQRIGVIWGERESTQHA